MLRCAADGAGPPSPQSVRQNARLVGKVSVRQFSVALGGERLFFQSFLKLGAQPIKLRRGLAVPRKQGKSFLQRLTLGLRSSQPRARGPRRLQRVMGLRMCAFRLRQRLRTGRGFALKLDKPFALAPGGNLRMSRFRPRARRVQAQG